VAKVILVAPLECANFLILSLHTSKELPQFRY